MALFLLLALAMTATFLLGMQNALSAGWRDAARPLLTDYIDRLATEVGSPPSVERAQALERRLPVRVRITGPLVNWHDEADPQEHDRRWRNPGRDDEPRLLERTTADGHRIRFGLSLQA